MWSTLLLKIWDSTLSWQQAEMVLEQFSNVPV